MSLCLLMLLTIIEASKLLSSAMASQVNPSLIFTLLGYKMVPLFVDLLPAAFFLSALVVMTGLYSDQEITAMYACGISFGRLQAHMVAIGLLFALICFGLYGFVKPAAYRAAGDVTNQIKHATQFDFLRAGEFLPLNDQGQVIYIERISSDRTRLYDVFIHNQQQDQTIVAKEGWIQATEHGRYLTLQQGSLYQGQPNEGNFEYSEFELFGVLLPQVEVDRRYTMRERSFTELLELLPNDAAERQLGWRIVFPLTPLVLSFWFLPLARSKPRSSAVTKIIPAIVFYMIYDTSLGAIQKMVGKGEWPFWMGAWWLQLAVVLVFLAGLGVKRWRENQ